MSTRFFYTNLIDASGVVITPSSESTNLPASNVANEQMTKVWRTGASTATEYVIFDLGTSTAAKCAIIHNHTLTSGDSSIQVRGSTDNFSTSNVLVGSFTYSTGTMTLTFSSVSYRYWKIVFTKSSSSVTRDIGRIFLGNYSDMETVPDYDGWEESKDTRDTTLVTAGGQTYSESKPNGRKCSASYSQISQTDKDLIETVVNAVSITNTFFFQCDQTGPSSISVPWYSKLEKKPNYKVAGYNGSLVWDIKLDIAEQL